MGSVAPSLSFLTYKRERPPLQGCCKESIKPLFHSLDKYCSVPGTCLGLGYKSISSVWYFPGAYNFKASWDFTTGGRLEDLVAVLKLADHLL